MTPACLGGTVKRLTLGRLLSGFITLLTFGLFTLGLSGCGTSAPAPISVALTPSSAQNIDQTQTVTNISATVMHDSKNAGVTWTVSGGGTLGNQTATSATYNAPTSGKGAITATVTATSITDATKSATLTINVNPLPSISTGSLPAATAGTAYSATMSEAGGTSPYTWSITAGSLPAGISLNTSTGAISGTATGVSGNSVTFQVIDATKASAGSQSMTFTVNPPQPLTITTGSLPAGTTGTAYNQTVTATGGGPSYHWSVSSGKPARWVDSECRYWKHHRHTLGDVHGNDELHNQCDRFADTDADDAIGSPEYFRQRTAA